MLKIASLTMAALLASASLALACSCARYRTPQEHLAHVEVAFVGVVEKTERAGGDEAVTTFRVTETLKGARMSAARIAHPVGNGGNCGVAFREKTRVLVFAYKERGVLSTNSCMTPRFAEARYRAALR